MPLLVARERCPGGPWAAVDHVASGHYALTESLVRGARLKHVGARCFDCCAEVPLSGVQLLGEGRSRHVDDALGGVEALDLSGLEVRRVVGDHSCHDGAPEVCLQP